MLFEPGKATAVVGADPGDQFRSTVMLYHRPPANLGSSVADSNGDSSSQGLATATSDSA